MFATSYSLPDTSTEIKIRAERWRSLAKWFRDAGMNTIPLGGDKRPLAVNLDTGEPLFGVDDEGEPRRYAWAQWQATACQGRMFDGLWNQDGIAGHCRGVGVICDAPSRNLVCFDFDVNKETGALPDMADVANLLAELGLPDNYEWQAITGSGGVHVWLRADALWKGKGSQNNRLGTHGGKVELFARGKYVVAPGSCNDEKQSVYRWRFGVPEDAPAKRSEAAIQSAYEAATLPKPTDDTKTPKATPERTATPLQPLASLSAASAERVKAYFDKMVDGIAADIAKLPEGSRNDGVKSIVIRAAAFWRDAAADGIWMDADAAQDKLIGACKSAGLGDGESTGLVRRKWQWGIENGESQTDKIREIVSKAQTPTAHNGTPAMANGAAQLMSARRKEYAAEAVLSAADFAEIPHDEDPMEYSEPMHAVANAAYGWPERNTPDWHACESASAADALPVWLVAGEPLDLSDSAQPAAEVETLRWLPLSMAEFMNMPSKVWLVEQLFGAGDLVMLYGQPNAGKSFLAVDLACALASGIDFAGQFAIASQLRTVYVCGEGLSGMRDRFSAAMAYHGITGTPDELNLQFVPDVPQLAIGEHHAADTIFQFITDMESVPTPLPQVVIIDTLASASLGLEENSAKDVQTALAALRYLAQRWQAAVILVHHSGKADAGVERGSSAMRGAMDAMVLVETNGGGDKRKMKCSKLRDGVIWTAKTFRLMAKEASAVVEWLSGDDAADEPDENADGTLTNTGYRNRILDALHNASRPLTKRTLAELIGVTKVDSLAAPLRKLQGENLVTCHLPDEKARSKSNAPLFELTSTGRVLTRPTIGAMARQNESTEKSAVDDADAL